MSLLRAIAAPAGRPANLLRRGNTKLGKSIVHWSIPAGLTCPGKTALCAKLCYAARGHYHSPSIKKGQAGSHAESREPSFARSMSAEIRRTRPRTLRIHVAGDFEDTKAIADWTKVVKVSPETTFYAYTRSWRVPELLPALVRLSKLPNMHLWFSEDRETGPSPKVKGVRVAYLVADAAGEADVPTRADLVFREHAPLSKTPLTVAKAINGVRVCPYEQGVIRKAPITCERCKICFTAAKSATK